MLYSEWPWENMTPFLASGNGVACDGDELSQAPAGAPVGYPTMFLPPAAAGGQPVGAGSSRVYVCDDHSSDFAPITAVLDVDPDVDVNKRILIRAVGITGTGASASIEQVVMAGTAPALLVNGNLSVRGDINVNGAAGVVHANGTMDIVGNSVCAEQFFSATDAITGGIPEGGAGCDDDGEVRPGLAPINIRVMSAADYKSRAQYWLSSYCAAVNGGGQCTDVQGKVYRTRYGYREPGELVGGGERLRQHLPRGKRVQAGELDLLEEQVHLADQRGPAADRVLHRHQRKSRRQCLGSHHAARPGVD